MHNTTIKKRGFALFLSILMAFSMFSAAAFAEGEETGIPMAAGLTIEEGNTYTISNMDELKAFRTLVEKGNTFAGATVKLLKNIDLADGTRWTAIGASVGSSASAGNMKVFSGTFDGNGKMLTDISYYYASADMFGIGIFAKLSGATVKNLRVKNISVYDSTNRDDFKYVGGLAGYALNSTIDNCYVSGHLTGGKNPWKMQWVGGIVGYAANTTITNTTNALSMEMRTSAGDSNYYGVGNAVGGILGYASGNNRIINCVNEVRIAVAGGDTYYNEGVGGIVGKSVGSIVIDRCINKGEIIAYTTGSGSVYTGPAGGIAGLLQCSATISNCWNQGYVAPYGEGGGGIVGLCGGTLTHAKDASYSGSRAPVEIFNCLNTGKVWANSVKKAGTDESTAKSSAQGDGRGGIVGYVGTTNGAKIENCYNQGAVIDGSTYSSARFSGGIIGHTTTGSYNLAYANHTYLLDQNDGLATGRWYTSQGGGAIGTRNCTKNYLAQMRSAAEEHCAALNAYASKNTVWTYSTENRTSVTITETEDARDYAEWIFDSDWEINKGLPYLDLPNAGYSETPAVTYTLKYDANGGENAPAAQTADSRTGSAQITISKKVPTYAGHLFGGWSTTKGGAAEYDAGAKITVTAPEQTLYAVWTVCGHENDLEYTDNKDGTHDGTCPDCKKVIEDDKPHVDKDDDGACDDCGAAVCGHTDRDAHGNCTVEGCKHPESCCPKENSCTDEKNTDGEETPDGKCDQCGECTHDKDADGYCTVENCPHIAAGDTCCRHKHVDEKNGDGEETPDGKCDECGECLHDKDADDYCTVENCPHIAAGDTCCRHKHVDEKNGDGEETPDGKCDECEKCLHFKDEFGYCTVDGCDHDEDCCPKGHQHVWNSGAVTKKPTCTTDGEALVTCQSCGATKTEVLPIDANAHDWGDFADDGGKHTRICRLNAAHQESEEHSYGAWVTVTAPTADQDGVRKQACTVCGHENTDSIPAGSGSNDPENPGNSGNTTPGNTTPGNTTPGGSATPGDEEEIPDADIPQANLPVSNGKDEQLDDIEDDTVPQAGAPKTGDSFHPLWMAAALMSGACMALFGKKRKDETA